MTVPELFIIESLRFEDEKNNRFEGKIVADILNLNGRRSAYYYIRTKSEFLSVLRLFGQSNYRFLHLSCFGNASSMFTTLDTVYFGELAAALNPVIGHRRLFVSAPSIAQEAFAGHLWPRSRCYSLVGPVKSVKPTDAAMFWAAFYHLVPSYNWETMKRQGLIRYLDPISVLFDIPLNYFYACLKDKQGFRHTPVPKRARKTARAILL